MKTLTLALILACIAWAGQYLSVTSFSNSASTVIKTHGFTASITVGEDGAAAGYPSTAFDVWVLAPDGVTYQGPTRIPAGSSWTFTNTSAGFPGNTTVGKVQPVSTSTFYQYEAANGTGQ